MRIKISRSYFGPNQHARGPAAYLLVDSGDLAAAGPARHLSARLWGRLRKTLRSVAAESAADTHVQEEPERPAFVECEIGELIEFVVRSLLESVGDALLSVAYPRGCCGPEIDMIMECSDAEVGRRAGELAVNLLNSLLEPPKDTPRTNDKPLDVLQETQALRRLASARRPTPTNAAILAAAAERNIPVIRLDRWPFVEEDGEVSPEQKGLLQLGQGVFQKRLRGTASESVRPKSHELLGDHHETCEALRKAGIPVPVRDLEFANLNNPRRVLRCARRIGYPLTVKPRRRTGGLGVTVDLHDDEALTAAYHTAAQHGRQVIVERHVFGDTYRLLVIAGEVVAACRKPRAGTREKEIAHSGPLTARNDEVALDRLAPELKATAVRAAACFYLDVAGVDVVTPDVSLTLEASGGTVIGVDPAPDLALHLSGDERIPMAAAKRFLAYHFPPVTHTRIPVISVTGTNGKTTTCRMLAAILQAQGRKVGLACTDGVYIRGELRQSGRVSDIADAVQVFLDPEVDTAVLETSRGTLAMKGLAFTECDLGACTNVADDHIGQEGIESNAQMANLKRVVLQTALTGVVLNGDDPLGLAMMPYLDTQEIFLITWNPEKPELQTHLAKGHPAITVVADGKRQWITLLQANKQKPIAAIEDIPATFNGSARYNVENAMFAAALSIGLGVKPETIQQALARFTSSLAEVPGRMNEYRGLPFRVILDFAHNAHAFAALSDFANQIEVEGRRLILMFSPGNRREVDFLATARAVAGKFDNYVIRQGSNTFLRADGEVPEILKKHLLSLGVAEESVRTILDYDEAVDYTLNCAAPGDLLVIASGGKYQRTWDRLDVFRTSLLATNKRPKSD